MAIAQSGPPPASSGNLDDGVRLRSFALGTIAKAARVSHLDVRLQDGAGRQGLLRTGLRLARETAQRRTRPHLQQDQQSRFGNAGGSSHDLGRSRGEPRLRLGHGGHLDDVVGLCPAWKRPFAFRSGIWGNGFSAEKDTPAIWRDAGRVSRRGRHRGLWRPRPNTPSRSAPSPSSISKPRPTRPTVSSIWRRRARSPTRCAIVDRRSSSTTRCSVRCIKPR